MSTVFLTFADGIKPPVGKFFIHYKNLISMSRKKERMTKTIDWVKLPVNLMDDARVCELMARKGMAGLGVYLWIIVLMYRRSCHSFTKSQVKALKVPGATPKTIQHVLTEFGLFECDQYGHVYSVIDFFRAEEIELFLQPDSHAMATRLQRPAVLTPAGINRDTDTDILLEAGAAKKRAGEGKVRSPEEWAAEYIRQLSQEDEWAELTMMKSGFSQLLQRNWALALEEFRKHVVVNRTAESIHDVECAKQYFSRYVTNATTGPQLRKALEEHERTQQSTGLYCHEDRNSAPGHRSYHGFPLPDDAPPRPDEQSEWDYEEHCWLTYRHVQEDKYATEQY